MFIERIFIKWKCKIYFRINLVRNEEKLDLSKHFNNDDFKSEWNITSEEYFNEQNVDLYLSTKEYPFQNEKSINENLKNYLVKHKVLVIGNQLSLNTNFGGIQDWLNSLQIDNAGSLKLAKDGNSAYRDMGNLSFKVIYNSGEEIWRDQPEQLNKLISNFLN